MAVCAVDNVGVIFPLAPPPLLPPAAIVTVISINAFITLPTAFIATAGAFYAAAFANAFAPVLVFSRVHATLYDAMSVGRLVGWSVMSRLARAENLEKK